MQAEAAITSKVKTNLTGYLHINLIGKHILMGLCTLGDIC